MKQEVQKFWDKQAKRYDRAEKQFASVNKRILTKTSTYLNHNDYALDYGCATGSKTIELAQKVKHIHGLDISEGMINEALRKKNELKVSNISFSQGTIFDSNLEEGSYDSVTAFAIIHLLEDNDKVVQRIYELLKPGGFFISTTACMKERMGIGTRIEVSLFVLMRRLGLLSVFLNLFRFSEVNKLIGDHNFQIIETEEITEGIPAIFIVARK